MTKFNKDTLADEHSSHDHLMSGRSSVSLSSLETDTSGLELQPSLSGGHRSQNESSITRSSGNRFKPLQLLARVSGYIWSLVLRLCRSKGGMKYMVAAELSASVMAVTTRALETTQDPPFSAMQILCVRMIFTSLFCTCYVYYKDIPDKYGPPGLRWALIIRGISGFFGVFGLYYSLNYLSLSEATILTFLSPSLTGITCWFFLKEALYPWEVVGTFFSMAGVFLIVKPPFLFPSQQEGDPKDAKHVTHAQRMLACGVSLLGVLGIVVAFTMIRLVGDRVHPLVTVTYFSHITLIISTVWLLVSPTATFILPHSPLQCFLLFTLGICGFAMQFLVTQALVMERASKATNMIYLQLFFAVIFEKIIWGTTPDWLSVLGSVLIIGSSLVVALMKDRSKKIPYDEENSEPANKYNEPESQELQDIDHHSISSSSDDQEDGNDSTGAIAVESDFENIQNTRGLHERRSVEI